MVKTITMTALLFLAGVGAVLWLMPYEWLWIVPPLPCSFAPSRWPFIGMKCVCPSAA